LPAAVSYVGLDGSTPLTPALGQWKWRLKLSAVRPTGDADGGAIAGG